MSESREESHARGMEVRRDGARRRARRPRRSSGRRRSRADFQDLITRYAWGEIWSRPGLDRRTRSVITLTALVATGREHELEMHVRAALRNGLTPDEIGEVLLQCAVYCGVPAANGAFAIAQRVIDEGADMTRAVVLSAVRTPVGRYGGGLADVRPDDLAAIAVAAAVERAGVAPGEIEDVWLGCANQAGEDNRNVARFAALLAGFPDSVAGVTVNRLCASGLSAVVGACHAVIAGDGDLFVAGGVESMTRAPLVTAKPDAPYARGNRTIYDTTLGWRFTNPRYEERFSSESMGETGENVAERWGVSREDQDAFALRSQERWAAAHDAGTLRGRARPGRRARARRASAPGHDGGEARRARSRRSGPNGTVTAGNASGINDGAAALVIASEERARDARSRAARGVRRLRGRRGRSGRDGHRPRARRPQAARADRCRGRRRRPRRAERGVRLAVARGRARARDRRGAGERQRRRDRDRAPARHERRAARRVTLLHELRRRGGRYGARDDVRRRGAGAGGALRARRPA